MLKRTSETFKSFNNTLRGTYCRCRIVERLHCVQFSYQTVQNGRSLTVHKKDKRVEATLAFLGRVFHNLGAATEEALSCVPIKCSWDSNGAKRMISAEYLKGWEGSYGMLQPFRQPGPKPYSIFHCPYKQ